MVHLVVVHRNRGAVCAATVGRFLLQDDLTVTVVDNGSSVTEIEQLRSGLRQLGEPINPRITIVETGRNLGFGPGANVGLKRWLSGEDGDPASDICLLGPHDVRPGPGVVHSIVEGLEDHPEAGLACADVGDGRSPMIQPWLGPIGRPPAVNSGWEEVDYPHGTLMGLRRSCLELVGLFDERYFAYCEEADLGIRVRNAGWTVGLLRGSLVQNPESSSAAAVIDYLMVRNTLLLLRTHFGIRNMLFRIGVVAAEHVVGWWRPAVRGPYHSGRARSRAVCDALLGRYGPWD
ncbi:MAG TPA: glycosyl transferase [Acidimicrobiaceae bacterium]|nr:glycosyl transferase [Acidimicrobiaceae bacterium]HCV34101.1 glycosyl transferase [Acidimicrobiaceae bacterium]